MRKLSSNILKKAAKAIDGSEPDRPSQNTLPPDGGHPQPQWALPPDQYRQQAYPPAQNQYYPPQQGYPQSPPIHSLTSQVNPSHIATPSYMNKHQQRTGPNAYPTGSFDQQGPQSPPQVSPQGLPHQYYPQQDVYGQGRRYQEHASLQPHQQYQPSQNYYLPPSASPPEMSPHYPTPLSPNPPSLVQSPYSPPSTTTNAGLLQQGLNQGSYFPATSPDGLYRPVSQNQEKLPEMPRNRNSISQGKYPEVKSPNNISPGLIPAASPPPPQYSAQPASELAPPSLNQAFQSLNLSASPIPTADQCLAHLKLLEAFFVLREGITKVDGLFGLNNEMANKWQTQNQIPDIDLIREKRWAIYVARAVDRFQAWWELYVGATKNGGPARKLKQADLDRGGKAFEESFTHTFHFPHSADALPPLDVLMVWHAYMLNPRSFAEDCLRLGKIDFWAYGMPWSVLNSVIDPNTYEYHPPAKAIEAFEGRTRRDWDNLTDSETKQLVCPKCQNYVEAPWFSEKKAKDVPAVKVELERGTGYAEKGFKFSCKSCGNVFNHDYLQLLKFKKDVQALFTEDAPLAGTILSMKGLPERVKMSSGASNTLFPNQLIKKHLNKEIMELAANGNSGGNQGIDQVRDMLGPAVKKENIARNAKFGNLLTAKVNGKPVQAKLVRKADRIAVRRMMSRYWGNSSPFALDLVGAVVRQGQFIEKMHNIAWLRSPAAQSTMARLCLKYERFFGLFATNPGKTVVPTLDVDLAWHTHQLSPPAYYAYSLRMTAGKIFIDHDDKIEESKLSSAFEWTSKMYQKKYGVPYSECDCWYCNAVRESHDSTASSKLFGTGRKKNTPDGAVADGSPTAFESDPQRAPHISAHNAVRLDVFASERGAHDAKLDRAYKAACKKAVKAGKKPPMRDAFMYSAFGTALAVTAVGAAVYAPYMASGFVTTGYYACNPACMALGAGEWGNCAAGTCGGAVAAGMFLAADAEAGVPRGGVEWRELGELVAQGDAEGEAAGVGVEAVVEAAAEGARYLSR